MSANRRCSTGWSARSWRWSTIGPASRATGARARRICSASNSASSIPPAMRMRTPRRCPAGCARRPRRRCAQADVALFLIDARAGLVPLDEEIARWLRGVDHAGRARRQQGRGPRGRSGHHRSAGAGLRRSGRSCRPNMARAWSTCSRRCCRYIERRGRRGRPRTRTRTIPTRRSSWRSSGGPMPASRR